MVGIEPLAEQTVIRLAVPIFQIIWKGSSKLLETVAKSLDEKTQELIFTASKQYVQNYEKRHRILKVLGMREPVKLESVYTAVQFLDNDGIRSFESIENLEKFYRQAPFSIILGWAMPTK